MEPPQHPAGAYVAQPNLTNEQRQALIDEIAAFPAALRATVAGLSETQLDTLYKNWTIRQIVHHLADSHVNCYIRFKWALTENRPLIKAYEEGDWAALLDSRTGDIALPLALLDGLHGRWVQLLRVLTPQQFARTFLHPQTGEERSLDTSLGAYAWHGRHHRAQIAWLREQRGWAER